MPKGGLRSPPGGRPRGSRDKLPRVRTTHAQRVEQAVNEFLKTNNASIFEGNTLALFQSVYKNEDFPLALRLHAAALAAPYECPRLTATATISKHVDDGDDAAFGRWFQRAQQLLAAHPERQAEILDMTLAEDDAEP